MDTKQTYADQAEAKLTELNAEIERWKAKALTAEANTMSHAHDRLEDLRAREIAARRKLKELQEAGGDAWASLRSGVDDAIEQLVDALSK